MKILFLAPEPYYQDRGTPIAIRLLLRVLSERGDQVDVVTYHEGSDVVFCGVTLYRIGSLPFIRNIRPGFSWKKLICDLLLLIKSRQRVRQNRYDLIFAVEESVFIALLWKWVFKIPYVYDMDSSLVEQMLDKYILLKPFKVVLTHCERLAVKNAIGVAPMCKALATIILTYEPKKVVVLEDVPAIPQIQPE